MSQMGNLEITKACAEAMGYEDKVCDGERHLHSADGNYMLFSHYNPLKDDAQAMALVKKFRLNVGQLSGGWCKVFTMPAEGGIHEGESQDLNLAICLCVAHLKEPQ